MTDKNSARHRATRVVKFTTRSRPWAMKQFLWPLDWLAIGHVDDAEFAYWGRVWYGFSKYALRDWARSLTRHQRRGLNIFREPGQPR